MKYNYYLLLIDNQFLQLAKTLKLGRLIPSAEPNDIIFIAAIGEGGGIISPGIPFSDLARQEIRWPDFLGEPDNNDMDYVSELYFQFCGIAESNELQWIILVDTSKFSQLIGDLRSSFNVDLALATAGNKTLLRKTAKERIIATLGSQIKYAVLSAQDKTNEKSRYTAISIAATSAILTSILFLPAYYNEYSNMPASITTFSITQITTMIIGLVLGAILLRLCYLDMSDPDKQKKRSALNSKELWIPLGIYLIFLAILYNFTNESLGHNFTIISIILTIVLAIMILLPSRFYMPIVSFYMVGIMLGTNVILGYLTTSWQFYQETTALKCGHYYDDVSSGSRLMCIDNLRSSKWQPQDTQIQQTGSSPDSRTTHANYSFTYNECVSANLEVYQDFNPKDSIFGNTHYFQDRTITLQPVMEHPFFSSERFARYAPGHNSWKLLEWSEQDNDKYSRVRDYQLISEGQTLGLKSTQAVLRIDENNCDLTDEEELNKVPQELMKHINLASSQYIDSTFIAINDAAEVKTYADDLKILAGPNVNRAILPQNDQEGLRPENWNSSTILLIKGIDENNEIPISVWLSNRSDLDYSWFDGQWESNAWRRQPDDPFIFSLFLVNRSDYSSWEYGISISDPTALVGETIDPTELEGKLRGKLSYLFDSSYLFQQSMDAP